MAKIISVFNHKGGVAKTTTVYHLGAMLAKEGLKVLLVDADSQCNLSQIVLQEEGFQEFTEKHPTENIKDALEPAFKAQPKLIQPLKCAPVKDYEDQMFLMMGSLELETYAVELGVAFMSSDTFATTKNLPGSFHYLISKTAEKYGCDVILVDMNPSLGAINQVLLMSSDYFIIPAAPDYLSIMAIKSLSRMIPRWEAWAKKARDIFKDAVYPLPQNTPKFLGYTANDFNIKNQKPTKAVQDQLKKLSQTVKEELIPELTDQEMTLEKYSSNNENEKYLLGKIQDFQSTLKTAYQDKGRPVWNLDQQDLTKGAYGNTRNIVDRVEKAFKEIADLVVTRAELPVKKHNN